MTDKDNEQSSIAPLMNESISNVFKTTLRLCLSRPHMVRTLLRLRGVQVNAANKREKYAGEGIVVPPVLILSVTNRCNLRCKGCYAKAHTWDASYELEFSVLDEILTEAEDLGVSFAILAGGEPFLRKDLLTLTKGHQDMIFPLFTNGLMIKPEHIEELKGQRHVIPIISIEGGRALTDNRRGAGTFEVTSEKMKELSSNKLDYGVSITVGTNNIDEVLNSDLVHDLYEGGCRIFYFIEYISMQDDTCHLEISSDQRKTLLEKIDGFKGPMPGIYVTFPGDESKYGGCLSSGRGFVHINPSGGLEPCPAAPFSDIDLKKTHLKEALQSDMLATLRENLAFLDESGGGCALWHNRDAVEKLFLKRDIDFDHTG